jgi:hypothetical protein
MAKPSVFSACATAGRLIANGLRSEEETEHSGPKRGRGAYWGYKWEAKKESNRMRRENWKREIRDESTCAES